MVQYFALYQIPSFVLAPHATCHVPRVWRASRLPYDSFKQRLIGLRPTSWKPETDSKHVQSSLDIDLCVYNCSFIAWNRSHCSFPFVDHGRHSISRSDDRVHLACGSPSSCPVLPAMSVASLTALFRLLFATGLHCCSASSPFVQCSGPKKTSKSSLILVSVRHLSPKRGPIQQRTVDRLVARCTN